MKSGVQVLVFGAFLFMVNAAVASEICGLKSNKRGGVVRTVGNKIYDTAILFNPENLNQYLVRELVQRGVCSLQSVACEVVEASDETVLTGPQWANIKVGKHTFTKAPFKVQKAYAVVEELQKSGICH